jgi:hypothetical protein
LCCEPLQLQVAVVPAKQDVTKILWTKQRHARGFFYETLDDAVVDADAADVEYL